MTNDQATESNRKKKHRSPNYPFVSLEEALTRAAILKDIGGIHPVGFRNAMTAWGYKSPGTTASVIAALKAYGLVEVAGEGDKRQIQLNKSARQILADTEGKAELVKRAALTPTLYRKLWERFGGDLPPSDKIIEEYLEFELNFNPAVMAAAIADFRSTIAYAELSNSDIIDGEGGETSDEEAKASHSTSGNRQKTPKLDSDNKSSIPVLTKGVVFNITIDVLEGGQINVTNGGTLTSETFSILKDVFDLKEKHEIKAPSKPTSESVDLNTLENVISDE